MAVKLTTDRMVEERTEGLKAVAKLRPLVNKLTVNDSASYLKADEFLSQVMHRRREWKGRMAEILNPLDAAVKAARVAKDSANKLFLEVDGPMQDIELQVKGLMAEFKLEERRQLQAAEEERQREIAKLQEQERLKTEAEAKAKTPAMSSKLLEAKARIQQALADKKAEEAPSSIKGASSQARFTTKCRVVDKLALLQHIVSEVMRSPDSDLICMADINAAQLNAYFKLSEPKVGEDWLPGVVVFEEANIAGKR